MEENEKRSQSYPEIISEFIDAINAQKHIVPIAFNFLSVQMVADTKKLEKYGKEHGEVFEKDGGEGIRMSIQHSAVMEKLVTNLDYTARSFKMSGVNAVIGMVCNYDGYLGLLTKQIFRDKPEILNGSDREFKASDILSYADFDELKEVLVEKEIESLLRKNHVEQIQWLESKLNIELRKFKLFPDFVEIMERRNLFVHSNGVVSRQYLSECKKNGVQLDSEIKVGDELEAFYDYVRKAYSVLFQVGVMLGYVLWHKIKPEEGEDLINNLSIVAYDLIKNGEYLLGLDIIDFALSNKSWAKEINNAQQLVFRVNKALAFHLRDMQDECEKIIGSMDLTAAEPVYHLAVAVLRKEYDEAYKIMGKIGKDEDMKMNYKIWPLFNKIRLEDSFAAKFKEIYDEDYVCDDVRVSDFEEVIGTAMEMVKKTKEMNEGQPISEIDAELVHDEVSTSKVEKDEESKKS